MTHQCDTFGAPLLSYDEALAECSRHIETPSLGWCEVVLKQALGRVLAKTQHASINVPPADHSAMDGYALRTADLHGSGETVLTVSQRIPAGQAALQLQPGTAAQIFTGALIPEGADSILMQEQVIRNNAAISFQARPQPGDNIRRAGSDIRMGEVILQKGRRLRAQDIGLAASVGLTSLPVFNRIRVGMFLTGNELVEPGQALAAGKIYDSNRYTLYGLLQSLGCEIVDLGQVGDRLSATKQVLLEAAEKTDLVVTCGGVSVGEEDHIRNAVEQVGRLHFWRLGIKPGKPLAFGQIQNTLLIGLPGNPVSVFATFCLLVCPIVSILQGRRWQKPLALPVKSGFDWPRPDSRREFLRARLEKNSAGEQVARIYPNQDSSALSSAVWAQGFVEIAEGQTVQAGDPVNYLLFSQFLE